MKFQVSEAEMDVLTRGKPSVHKCLNFEHYSLKLKGNDVVRVDSISKTEKKNVHFFSN